MRAVVQRVTSASVLVDGVIVGDISTGLTVLLGIHTNDTREHAEWMAHKLAHIRLFADEQDKMNLSVLDCKAEILVVSQFTLYGDTRKGFRPSFIDAARPEIAEPLYLRVVELLRDEHGVQVATGIFGAMMEVALVNWGPVTVLVEK